MIFYTLLLATLCIQASGFIVVKEPNWNLLKVTRSLQDQNVAQKIVSTTNQTSTANISLTNGSISAQSQQNTHQINGTATVSAIVNPSSTITNIEPAQSLANNQADNFSALIEKMKTQHPEAEIIIVNNSPDVDPSHQITTIRPTALPYGTALKTAVNDTELVSDLDPEHVNDFADYQLQHLKYSNLYQSNGPITVDDIDTLNQIVELVNGVFEAYYAVLPKKSDAKQSALDRAADILELYAKIRSFVIMVKNDRQKIFNDMILLESKVNSLKTSQDDMLRFYGLNTQYDKAKAASVNFKGQDLQFELMFNQIFNTAPKFEASVRDLISSVATLIETAKTFKTQVQKLSNNTSNNQILKMLSKLDAVMLIVGELIAMEDSIKKTINTLKTSFMNLKNFRKNISDSISEINKLSEYHRLISISKAKKDVGITFTGFAMTLMLIVAAM